MKTAVTEAAKAAELVPGFDAAAFGRLETAGEPAILAESRRAAFDAYTSIPMPTRKVEEWRRTDLTAFPFAGSQRLAQIVLSRELPGSDWDSLFDVVVTVRDGSYSIRDMTDALGSERVFVLPLDQAATRFPDAVRRHLQEHGGVGGMAKFEALNEAFWNFGLFIYIPDGVTLPNGVLLRYSQARDRGIFIPRVIVTAGEESKATVAEHFASPDGVPMMSVSTKKAYVERAGQLRMVTLQAWGGKTHHLASDWAEVERDARLEWTTVNLGGRASKMNFGSDVAGEGASAELSGLFFGGGRQHLDQKTLQVHSSPGTYSNLLYKGAVKDEAYSVYQGLIVARPGAVRVDAYQKNNNLVLNDGARADSLPGLEIDADDLKCSHGSTIGNIDEEQLFYLRSRGLDKNEARRVLIRGFFEEVAARIPYEPMRDEVRRLIDAKLDAEG